VDHFELTADQEPVEKAGLTLTVTCGDEFLDFQHHTTVLRGEPEMRSLKVCDFGECMRDCRERFFEGHGCQRTSMSYRTEIEPKTVL
jgi:hypothetical protein